MKKIVFILITILFVFIFTQKTHASSSVVNISIDREFTVKDKETMIVKETKVVKNTTTNRIITKNGNNEEFYINTLYDDESAKSEVQKMSSTVKIKDQNNNNLNYSSSWENSTLKFLVAYPEDIQPGQSIKFIFEYENTQLVQKNGALVDIFIQAFSRNIQFTSGNVSLSYTTRLRIPKDMPEQNFVSPDPKSFYSQGNFDIYEFDQKQLVGNYVWVQRGKVQYYNFKVIQKILKTQNTLNGNTNEYRMIIPRSLDGVKTSQTVKYYKISPEPDFIEQDRDGNLIGVFRIPSNQDTEIIIEGFAQVNTNENYNIRNAGNLNDLLGFDKTYLSDAKYWEVNSSSIKTKALELKSNEKDIYKILENTYKFVVDSIDYSTVKRFGINERQGALATLNGGAAVCMEYSDLYITLLRAQGIPARAAFGYGYDSKQPADAQELHQWVQVYIPSQKKWMNIDPTWGENGPALIGGDMNHFLTHVASIDPNTPSTLAGKTYGGEVVFEPVKFVIEVTENPSSLNLMNEKDLLNKYKYLEKNSFEEIKDSLQNKFDAGIKSYNQTGFDITNSAQMFVLSIILIILFVAFTVFIFIIKIIKKFLNNPN